MTTAWHVAQTVPGLERRAAINLEAIGFSAFVPIATRRIVVRGIEIERPVVLFGPYIFVEFEREENDWRSINKVTGVRHLLPVREELPEPMPIGLVEHWLERSLAGEFDESDVLTYAVGDSVRMRRRHKLRGAVGEYIGMQDRMMEVLMTILGREIIMKVSPRDVEPA